MLDFPVQGPSPSEKSGEIRENAIHAWKVQEGLSGARCHVSIRKQHSSPLLAEDAMAARSSSADLQLPRVFKRASTC